jgi:phage N-6-adenine-methyltransferase
VQERDANVTQNGRVVTRPKTDAERAKAYRDRKRQKARNHRLAVHFSSENGAWETPQAFFDELNTEFSFELDVCALPENAKCEHYFTPDQDRLMQPWRGVCYMNPPYGRDIELWVQKAFEASLYGATVVCLLPGRSDTRWWQRYVKPLPQAEKRELPGRLRFGNAPNSAPFPSVLVIFRPDVS